MDEIQVLVKGFGKPFDDKETLELLRDANVRGDGNIFYKDFVESLFNLAPELYEIKVNISKLQTLTINYLYLLHLK